MIHLTRKIDFCPPEELLGSLALAPEALFIPETPGTFDNEEAAKSFLLGKGYLDAHRLVALPLMDAKIPAAAVKVIEKLQARAVELVEKIKVQAQPDAEGKDTWLDGLKAEIIARTKGQKSKTKTCDACESKIAVAYLRDFNCPVCLSEDFLLTTTDSDKIRSREERIASYRRELVEVTEKVGVEERKALTGSTEFRKVWVVYGREGEVEMFDQAAPGAPEALVVPEVPEVPVDGQAAHVEAPVEAPGALAAGAEIAPDVEAVETREPVHEGAGVAEGPASE